MSQRSRQNLQPYMIFADSTLREMAQHCPSDLHSMIRISGVGERKLEKYGSIFLEEIRVFTEEFNPGILAEQHKSEELAKAPTLMQTTVSTDSLQGRRSAKASTGKVLSHEQTFILYQEGHSLEDIAKVRNVT